ncbi:MAG TPA: hypothetical protein VD902_07575 [Symbiobacteriaceae bacterium]|nr:hypothetical protein [Symbiobacteriaceae bacterium]
MEQMQAQIPLEVIAAITAAIATVLDQPADSFVLRSVEPVGAGRPLQSVWAKAGVLESHLARRQFGVRGR